MEGEYGHLHSIRSPDALNSGWGERVLYTYIGEHLLSYDVGVFPVAHKIGSRIGK